MKPDDDLHQFRREYDSPPLRRADLAPDPGEQFRRWFADAVAAGVNEPNAMVLATSDRNGRPSARYVLLKHFGPEGFTFFTNYESDKGRDLASRPVAALLFFWEALNRQVRIGGTVERCSREVSTQYFGMRPRASRLAALVSNQSRLCPSREDLEERYREADALATDTPIPCPAQWGGFIVRPEEYEFWQGRRDRLHDRFRYRHTVAGWEIQRLDP